MNEGMLSPADVAVLSGSLTEITTMMAGETMEPGGLYFS